MRSSRQTVTCYVVAYDISNDRRRAKIHKVLSGFGQWTQFSVFECHLTAKQHVALRDKLNRIVEPAKDSVRFYVLCRDCLGRVDTIGGKKPQDEKLILA